MKDIKKVICIGANCIAADITKSLGIREKGPMDNIANFPISKAYLLFNKEIKKEFFKYRYKKRDAVKVEKEKWHFEEKIFEFRSGFSIVHNNFESKKFRFSLRKRIKNFSRFYKKSKKDNSLWYIYSLNFEDKYLNDIELTKIYKTLPKCCTERLICIGIRERNPLFEKYFKYYLELPTENDFKWGDTIQAEYFASELLKKYQIKISKK